MFWRKRLHSLILLEKKIVYQSEISTYSLSKISEIVNLYGVMELLKVNQIDIPDYQ